MAKAFNEAWYRAGIATRGSHLQPVTRFFYPLNGVADWNRLYGPRGLVQYQCVVPTDASEASTSARPQNHSAGRSAGRAFSAATPCASLSGSHTSSWSENAKHCAGGNALYGASDG